MLILKFILTVLILSMVAKIANVKYVEKFKIEYSIVLLSLILLMYFNSDVVEYSLYSNKSTIDKLQDLLDRINKLNANGGTLSEDIEIDGNVEIVGTLSFGPNSSLECTKSQGAYPVIAVKANIFGTLIPFSVKNLEFKNRNGTSRQTVRARNLIGFNACKINCNKLFTYVLAQRHKYTTFRNFTPDRKFENLTFTGVIFEKNVAMNAGTSPSFTNEKENVCNGDWYIDANQNEKGQIRVQKHDHDVKWDQVRVTRKAAIEWEWLCETGPQEDAERLPSQEAVSWANHNIVHGTDYPDGFGQLNEPCSEDADCLHGRRCIQDKCF